MHSAGFTAEKRRSIRVLSRSGRTAHHRFARAPYDLDRQNEVGRLGLEVVTQSFFDTITVRVCGQAARYAAKLARRVNQGWSTPTT